MRPSRWKSRRLVSYLLAGGLLLSLALSAAFYILLTTSHPPSVSGQPVTNLSVKAWADIYTNWYNAHLLYAQGYQSGLLAASVFMVLSGIFLADRLAAFASPRGSSPEGDAMRPSRWKSRRLVSYLLAGGLLLSLALSAAFYILLTTSHPPSVSGQPVTNLSVKAWADIYTNWYNAHLLYAQGYQSGLLAASVFMVLFGISLFPRLALLTSFSLLNLYYAWTSHYLADISKPFADEVTKQITSLDNFLWANSNLRNITGDTLVVADLEGLALLGALMISALLLNLGKGAKTALLLSSQVTALCLMVLGTEIAVFDYGEFYLHVTQVQVTIGLAPWFTNADLLFSALTIFVASTFILHFHRFRPYFDARLRRPTGAIAG